MKSPADQQGGTLDGQLVCAWRPGRARLFQSGMRVVVDESTGTVTFEHCHRARTSGSLAMDVSYSCRLDELQAVHLDWLLVWVLLRYAHGRDATVSTPLGKAVFNSRMDGFQEVVEAL